MSDLPSIEDILLLSITLIDAVLLVLVLLILLRSLPASVRNYILAGGVLVFLTFLFTQEQSLDISEPAIEKFTTTTLTVHEHYPTNSA